MAYTVCITHTLIVYRLQDFLEVGTAALRDNSSKLTRYGKLEQAH